MKQTPSSHHHRRYSLSRIVACLYCILMTVQETQGFKYKLDNYPELIAPEMLCFSGEVSKTKSYRNSKRKYDLVCPTTSEQIGNYHAVVMDDAGYVMVKLNNVKMRDDGRRRHSTLEDMDEYEGNRKAAAPLIVEEETIPHHLQIYLISLEEYKSVLGEMHCCYESEIHRPSWLSDKESLPKECTQKESSSDASSSSSSGNSSSSKIHGHSIISHDYRIHAPRIGSDTVTSPPILVNDTNDSKSIDVVARLKPQSKGPHMIVISNCAAEMISYYQEGVGAKNGTQTMTYSPRPLKAVISSIEVNFVSKFGELPMNLMGIIPFYGLLAACYGVISAAWITRSRKTSSNPYHHRHHNHSNVNLLGLQKAIRLLVFAQTAFCAIAFLYYLHLNGTSVDVDVLYSGTAAALVSWGPWSILVALVHFVTIFACQIVVTLATDGTWLIQHNVRPQTKKALMLLAILWLVYFILYGWITIRARKVLFMIMGGLWIVFLMCNIRQSLRHLRTLMVGQSNDRIMAVGGALVAKRSLFRKMCVVVGVYPLVFVVGLLWTTSSRQDSWAWVGYVLGDIYLFVILVHVSILWIPRPMASQEYVKYAPLEVTNHTTYDFEMWEGDMDGSSISADNDWDDSFDGTSEGGGEDNMLSAS
eukprot:CAMPEP_0195539028 /NCGR_PEP_ID=MMETSP0794_2-20130614/49843_1 /TAXON_ID=515487 /ORGANISM="Stephanopyxis turris, Strain CCMP 815" /LENGTH=643 /DNA_ID=CAMNT_0040673045 /DNA_START=273 /DNA_END=2204 /DNA_ORIENTATION=+